MKVKVPVFAAVVSETVVTERRITLPAASIVAPSRVMWLSRRATATAMGKPRVVPSHSILMLPAVERFTLVPALMRPKRSIEA